MSRRTIALASLIALVQAGILFLMGQPTLCECGEVKIWEGIVHSAGNSQHLTDWYTFSHIIHGILFYALLSWLFPRLSVSQRFLIALCAEAGWEILENTPMVIEHYRQQALAAGYTGDSILNSLSDTLMMALGFLFARKAPLSLSISLVVALEIFVLFSIRDNLTLNIIGLIHEVPAISRWQMGG